jgi:hypothetical protein
LDRQIDRHKHIQCKHCGAVIRLNKSGLCVECYSKLNSKNGLAIRKNHHKIVLCSRCKKQIGKNKTGLCIKCYALQIRKRQAENHKSEEIQHVKTVNKQSDKLSRNYKPSTCPKSPCGYHRWIINSENVGTCFYCDHTEKMPELKPKNFNNKPVEIRGDYL